MLTKTQNPSRRTFLQGSLSALFLAVSANGSVWAADAKKYGADAMPGGTVDDPLVFVSIAADGLVTIVAHRVEMGTGVRTSLPMVVADEMEANWDRVHVVQAEANETRYGNQNVDGSRSMRHFMQPMRRVGAAARHMLEAAAAARWSVPVTEVRATQHEVVHVASDRRLGYGELAADAAKQPVPKGEALRVKSPSDFRYIGKELVRLVDLDAIGKGQATYGIDMRLPGMVYAVVARPPVVGGKLRSVRSEKALQVPGVLKIVDIPSYRGAPGFQALGGVAVVASNTWSAMQGRAALEIDWDDGPNASYDSVAYRKTLEAAARAPGKVLRNDGNLPDVWTKAPETERYTAEYYLPHLAHASMEPPTATVVVKGDHCEVWTSVQDPQAALNTVATRLKFKPENVTVNALLLGGAFGRKSKPDFVDEAAIIAQTMPETPVKLVWTREDDIHHDYLHAVAVERLEAVVGKNGQPETWLHRSAAPTIASLFTEGAKGLQSFEAAMSAINMPYQIPHVRVETAEVPAYARIGWFRSVYNIPHAFAAQSFIAELAHRAGQDHKQFALDLIGPARKINPGTLSDTWNYDESPERYPYDTGRLRDVIEAATRGAGWGRTMPKGHGLGLAFCYSFMSYTATVVEVAVDDSGDLQVVAVDMAIDCGPQVNPERIRAQMQGGAIMGLSLALSGEISFKDGRVQQSNFHDYEVLRHAASPHTIRTHLVNDNHAVPPGGVGEPPVPPVAPALCNAIFAATGKRVRSLPVSL
ncbi:xanthine dehydrogenase family protein molybdopterin-binding subunit [Pollutimonas harenae]|uniref:Xanthine dehydrogenase family protein molybdopterin-binding subunit n=1 Tax=Pollutimonas harenae TaxID=657015 RepID=A0A853H568_9BURK|nr:molybdopterin cofactor-binding domain-containing protein [Pollutimonas harenae]NYT85693.1 xanthine dehydrogenase family protein molybdopterin-binding subunit [Pollutimonas harenae]TEA70765.1 xanthine dehydrogenase family protein molybdopterin-binding subunit [Pollutimonas harenae]